MSKARKKPAKKKPTKAKAPKKPTKKAARKKVAKTQPKKAKKAAGKKVAKTKPKKAKEKKTAKKVTKKKVAKTKPKKAKEKKVAKPKAKAKAKPSKKKTTVKKADEFDALERLVSSEDKRLGVKIARAGRSVSVDSLGVFCQALNVRDLRMLDSVKHQVARRGEMLGRIQSFTDRVKKTLGNQISVSVYLSDYDEVCMMTTFNPNKGQHPFDGDSAVADALRTSGLSKLMRLVGTGTMVKGGKTGARDHDFSEKKWEYVEPEAAVA